VGVKNQSLTVLWQALARQYAKQSLPWQGGYTARLAVRLDASSSESTRCNKRRRGKRRLPDRIKRPLLAADQPNQGWSCDFMADALWSGRRFRTFNVIDELNRAALRIEIDTSLPAARVIRALNELVEVRGAPLSIRMDNGPEFIAHALAEWAKAKGIALNHIQPGKPSQNAYHPDSLAKYVAAFFRMSRSSLALCKSTLRRDTSALSWAVSPLPGLPLSFARRTQR